MAAANTPPSPSAASIRALRADGTITCWGRHDAAQVKAPAGQFTAVTSGRWYACGLRTDGAITCWGDWSMRVAAG